MAQLNVHIPAGSSLPLRIEEAARVLGTSPSSLARAVLDVALEPYVQAHLEARAQVRTVSAAALGAHQRYRSGAVPMMQIKDSDSTAAEEKAAAVEPEPALALARR